MVAVCEGGDRSREYLHEIYINFGKRDLAKKWGTIITEEGYNEGALYYKFSRLLEFKVLYLYTFTQ